MEFDIDLTNLLELYCTNKFNLTFSANRGVSPSEPKKLAPKKKGIMHTKKIKEIPIG